MDSSVLIVRHFLLLFVIILQPGSLRADNGDQNTLRLVHVLFRHGDRSAITAYPNDIYKESDWPQGYGQLSKLGMMQEYKLGQFFRQSYVDSGFLSPAYTRTEVTVHSTDVDRTLMSAYSVLSGLFPPAGDQIWKKGMKWQPIPVHTAPVLTDKILNLGVDCPNYIQKQGRKDKLKETTLKKKKDFYRFVSEKAGVANSWEGVQQVLDPLFCQRAANMTLPHWVTDHIYKQVLELRDVYATVSVACRVNLVAEIVNHMLNKSSGSYGMPQKLFIYSAHDNTVSSFLNSLQVFNNHQPNYSACAIVQLHEDPPGKFWVKVAYKNESDTHPYELKLPDCDVHCPLDNFVSLMLPLTSIADTSTCDSCAKPSVGTTLVAVMIGALLLAVILGIILCFVKRERIVGSHATHDYAPVPMEMT